jgi:peptidoglycan/LPS O-acetylase OafA/YrhL
VPVAGGGFHISNWGALTYGSNWLDIVRGSGYWQTFAQASPLAHIWSLAIEEQFYVVWPLVAWWALRRGGARRLATVAAAGAVVLAAWALGLAWAHASVDRIYLGSSTLQDARSRLLNDLAAGASIVDYLGHGGIDRLSVACRIAAAYGRVCTYF